MSSEMGGVWVGERVRARICSLSARATLALLVGGGASVRLAFSLHRSTITYLPDEYTYAELARGFAQHGRPIIRGGAAHFPALLEPLLAAPFWLAGSASLAFRLTQVESSLVMSCGAIPVYLLSRRLQLGPGKALACALVALLSPNLLYGSYLTADAVVYPIALTAIYAGVVALDSGSQRAGLAFVVLAALAAFGRLQYLVLFPAYVAAAALAGRGQLKQAWRSVWVVGSVTVACAAAGLALGPSRLLGTYNTAFHVHLSIGQVLRQVMTDASLLPFSATIILVPGALVTFGRGLGRSGSTTERAFAALAIFFGLAAFGESVLGGAETTGNYIERYLICFLALIAPAFCLYARRGGARLVVVLLSAGLALLAIEVPLSGDTASGRWTDSTVLYAVSRLEQMAGVGHGAMVASVFALGLAIIAGALAWSPKHAVAVALAASAGTLAITSVAATSWDIEHSRSALAASFTTSPDWIDRARLGPVTLLQTPGADPGDALEQLFWNTSLNRVVLLPNATAIDEYNAPAATVASNGIITAGGSMLSGPVLVDGLRTWLRFTGLRLVSESGTYRLYRPSGTPRLLMEATGSLASGWLASSGSITVWAQPRPMRLTVRLSLPRATEANEIEFRIDRRRRTLRIGPGQSRTASFVLPGHTASTILFQSARVLGYSEGTLVGFLAARPELTPLTSADR